MAKRNWGQELFWTAVLLTVGAIGILWIIEQQDTRPFPLQKPQASQTRSTKTKCPPIDPAAFWLPGDKQFALPRFLETARQINATGQCAIEGSWGSGYQKYYITVSPSGQPRDAVIYRFNYDDLATVAAVAKPPARTTVQSSPPPKAAPLRPGDDPSQPVPGSVGCRHPVNKKLYYLRPPCPNGWAESIRIQRH